MVVIGGFSESILGAFQVFSGSCREREMLGCYRGAMIWVSVSHTRCSGEKEERRYCM